VLLPELLLAAAVWELPLSLALAQCLQVASERQQPVEAGTEAAFRQQSEAERHLQCLATYNMHSVCPVSH
jgi:hypothetical protein